MRAGGGCTGRGCPSRGCSRECGFGARPQAGGAATVLFCFWLAWSRFRVVLPLLDKTWPSVAGAIDVALLRADGVPAYLLTGNEEAACAVFCDQVNARPHRVTRRAPAEMLAEERARLHPVAEAPFTAALGVTRTVDGRSLVTFEAGQYSVPHQLAGQENCGGLEGSVSRLRASHTSWNSCAQPIAATAGRPARAARANGGRITSIFRIPFFNLTRGMSFISAKRVYPVRPQGRPDRLRRDAGC